MFFRTINKESMFLYMGKQGKNKEKLFSQRVEFKTILKGVEQFFIWFILVVVETITITKKWENNFLLFY